VGESRARYVERRQKPGRIRRVQARREPAPWRAGPGRQELSALAHRPSARAQQAGPGVAVQAFEALLFGARHRGLVVELQLGDRAQFGQVLHRRAEDGHMRGVLRPTAPAPPASSTSSCPWLWLGPRRFASGRSDSRRVGLRCDDAVAHAWATLRKYEIVRSLSTASPGSRDRARRVIVKCASHHCPPGAATLR
jgi:hypothetical protein